MCRFVHNMRIVVAMIYFPHVFFIAGYLHNKRLGERATPQDTDFHGSSQQFFYIFPQRF